MRRSVIPELLDDDAGTPQEIADSLADLRFVNRWFGGISTTERLVRRALRGSGKSAVSLLEVGAGGGDVPLELQNRLANSGVNLSLTMLDRRETHFGASNGRKASSVVGDAVALPFGDNSFDLVHSVLFLHHLEPDQVRQFAREAIRVARVALIVNDLERNLVHLGLIHAGKLLERSRLTHHDSVASVKRAYTPGELREMLAPFGSRLEITRNYLYRLGAILWK